jgi:hypothetical protein
MSGDFWIGAILGAFVTGIVAWLLSYFRTAFERSALLEVTVHRAYPGLQPPECFFIRCVNQTPDRELEIKDVWFEGTPATPVLNPQRRLPARLRAGRMWETWIPTAEVPHTGDDVFSLARVRLSTGEVFRSHQTPDEELAPGVGGIAGGD